MIYQTPKKSTITVWMLLWIFITFTAAAGGVKEQLQPPAAVTEPLPAVAQTTQLEETKPAVAKYVFLFIGDGMGLPQVASAEIYTGAKQGGIRAPRSLSFTKFPAQGLTTTHDASSFITDSASAGTAIACGYKTLNGVISMDTKLTIAYKSIASIAKERNMKVGIISSVSIDHATPAVFYANQPTRKNMYEIALQLADSGFDYFAGGSIVDPDGKSSKMADKPGNVFAYAESKGYTITTDKAGFNRLKPGGKVWSITEAPADSSSMLYEIDRTQAQISLADFTRKGCELLDNPDGFFMMVEGGKIDWACHANDAKSAIADLIAFDDAVQVAVDFAAQYPRETLIIVTGDHECGGMTIGFAGTGYNTAYPLLEDQTVSYVKFNEILEEFKAANPAARFEDFMPSITTYFGLTASGASPATDISDYQLNLLKNAFIETMKNGKSGSTGEEAYLLYGGYEPLTVTLTHILNQRAGIGWTTYSHTGVPVPTYAYGSFAQLFDGYYDNTDIFHKIALAMGI